MRERFQTQQEHHLVIPERKTVKENTNIPNWSHNIHEVKSEVNKVSMWVSRDIWHVDVTLNQG